MEGLTNFHGYRSTSTKVDGSFHLLPWKLQSTSIYFHGSTTSIYFYERFNLLPSTSVGASICS